jgi:hypothetical protein
MLIFIEPCLPNLPVRQDASDQSPKLEIMIAVPQIAEIMDDGIFEQGFEGEVQMPVYETHSYSQRILTPPDAK